VKPEQEAYVRLLHAADAMQRDMEKLLKPYELSPPQFNALRILRGAGPDGLPSGQVAERMITRDPDVTRLLDRLETRGLIERGRREEDRRVVVARIAGPGLALLKRLDAPVFRRHVRQFAALTPAELDSLTGLLARLCDRKRGSRIN